MPSKGSPAFGQVIRAARQRFYLLPNRAGLMRLSDHPQGLLCELLPWPYLVRNERIGDVEYYLWHEKDHGVNAIAQSPFLRQLKRVKQPITVVLGDDGNVVGRDLLHV